MICKLDTETPVHVGNGTTWTANQEYITWEEASGSFVGVLSPEKIYGVVGQRGLEAWCSQITRSITSRTAAPRGNGERGFDMRRFLEGYGLRTGSDYRRVCSRVMVLARDVDSSGALPRAMKCCIRSRGIPYIPGSSLKGALVSALFSRLVHRMPGEEPSRAMQRVTSPDKYGEGRLLNALRVGDACFTPKAVMVTEGGGLNIRTQDGEDYRFTDHSRPMLYESVYSSAGTEVEITLRPPRGFSGGVPSELRDESSLLSAVNAHTQRLLAQEASFWSSYLDGADAGLLSYVEQLEELQAVCGRQVAGESALVRVGSGVGWDFVTGSWLRDEIGWLPGGAKVWDSESMEKLRPHNSVRYSSYPFPKSRRTYSGLLCGFCVLRRV